MFDGETKGTTLESHLATILQYYQTEEILETKDSFLILVDTPTQLHNAEEVDMLTNEIAKCS